jgi:predicted HicB family RNase H-like nuclease
MPSAEKKPVSKAQQKATAKYKKSNYDRMEILLSKGRKAALQLHAAGRGESLNGFVNRAIDETVERDGGEPGDLKGVG